MEGKASIYWVIAGAIVCRQPIQRLASYTDAEGKDYCDIIMAPDLIRTIPYPKRPFQGWRYLDPKDAPPDIAANDAENSVEIAAELARLGLL
jgi:hypothetical protein